MNSQTNLKSVPTDRRATTVWLVDEHKIYRSLLADFLSRESHLNCAREFSGAEAIIAALGIGSAPEVILLDASAVGRNAAEVVRSLKCLAPAARVVILASAYDSEAEVAALQAGASGFLWKGCFGRILDFIQNPKPPGRTGDVAKPLSLDRQVRTVAGALVVIGVLLGWFTHRGFFGLSAFVGAGLVLGGVTDFCGMSFLLTKLPWNNRRPCP